MALRDYQMMSTMMAASDSFGNGAWSLVIETPLIDCLRESLGTITGKGPYQRQFRGTVVA